MHSLDPSAIFANNSQNILHTVSPALAALHAARRRTLLLADDNGAGRAALLEQTPLQCRRCAHVGTLTVRLVSSNHKKAKSTKSKAPPSARRRVVRRTCALCGYVEDELVRPVGNTPTMGFPMPRSSRSNVNNVVANAGAQCREPASTSLEVYAEPEQRGNDRRGQRRPTNDKRAGLQEMLQRRRQTKVAADGHAGGGLGEFLSGL